MKTLMLLLFCFLSVIAWGQDSVFVPIQIPTPTIYQEVCRGCGSCIPLHDPRGWGAQYWECRNGKGWFAVERCNMYRCDSIIWGRWRQICRVDTLKDTLLGMTIYEPLHTDTIYTDDPRCRPTPRLSLHERAAFSASVGGQAIQKVQGAKLDSGKTSWIGDGAIVDSILAHVRFDSGRIIIDCPVRIDIRDTSVKLAFAVFLNTFNAGAAYFDNSQGPGDAEAGWGVAPLPVSHIDTAYPPPRRPGALDSMKKVLDYQEWRIRLLDSAGKRTTRVEEELRASRDMWFDYADNFIRHYHDSLRYDSLNRAWIKDSTEYWQPTTAGRE